MLVAGAGPAFADKIDPNGPYVWECGSSRSGGAHIEAYADTITVIVNDGNGRRTLTFHGRVAQYIPGTSSGSITLAVSNDGLFSTASRAYCSPHP